MDEQLLYYIWKNQKFNTSKLKTTHGNELIIIHTGFQNEDSGPDFKEARIKIDNLVWSGSVEIHIKSRDWYRHHHHHHPAYKNVVLHVVWKHDRDVLIAGEKIPTLELSPLVDKVLQEKYYQHVSQKGDIICESQQATISPIHLRMMLQQAVIERLNQKAQLIYTILKRQSNDWENTLYYLLVKNFGFGTNKHAFETLATCLPFLVVKKCQNNLQYLESLFFGVSGFLEGNHSEDGYWLELKGTFHFLSKKIPIDKKNDTCSMEIF